MIKTMKTHCWRGAVGTDPLWSPHWVLVCALCARGRDWWNNCLFLYLVLQKMNKYQQFNPWAICVNNSQHKGCGRRTHGSVSDCWQLAATDLRPCLCHRRHGMGWITSLHLPSLCHHHLRSYFCLWNRKSCSRNVLTAWIPIWVPRDGPSFVHWEGPFVTTTWNLGAFFCMIPCNPLVVSVVVIFYMTVRSLRVLFYELQKKNYIKMSAKAKDVAEVSENNLLI